ncbi:hypothetical protein DHL47_02225 [Streptococcus panodentis]|uniref:CPBP family intramembrane metalloprotease n=2 Tax=Streptococcus panodentis TaxID=1581472 RepID=A0ABS5AUC3_9STRE|nr:hypothetical protein [Streptococcus panodentis]
MRSTKLASSIWLPLLFWIFLLIFQELVPIKAFDNQSAVVELVKSQAVFAFLDTVLLAPIVEELMFRGFRATFFFLQQRKLPQILPRTKSKRKDYNDDGIDILKDKRNDDIRLEVCTCFGAVFLFGKAAVFAKRCIFPKILHKNTENT